MLHLLKLEWKKQRKFVPFRIILILYLALIPTLILVTKSLSEYPPPINSSDTFFQFPTVFVWLGYIGNWLSYFFLGFIAILIVTPEYSNRTLRQNIITGLNRREYYWSKVFFIIAVSIGITLFFGLTALAYGFTHTDSIYLSTIMKNIDYIPRYLLMCLGYMGFAFFLAIWTRRTGIALFLYFFFPILEVILRWAVHLNLVANKSMHFYPMNALDDILPLPFSEMVQSFEGEYGFSFFLSPTEASITVAVYTLIFFAGGYRLLLKRDL
jgi:ABC-2 type transport system permease protein